MRKLFWILILVAIASPTVYALCLQYPDTVGASLHNIFLVTIPAAFSNAATGLLAWGAASGWQAAAVIAGIFIVGNVLFYGCKRLLWPRRPITPKTVTQRIYQHAPTPALPQVTPEPVPAPAPAPAPEQTEKPQQEVPAE